MGNARLCLRNHGGLRLSSSLCRQTIFSGAVMHGFPARLKSWAMSPSARRKTLSTTASSERLRSWQAGKCPTKCRSEGSPNDSVFFLQSGRRRLAEVMGWRGQWRGNSEGHPGRPRFLLTIRPICAFRISQFHSALLPSALTMAVASFSASPSGMNCACSVICACASSSCGSSLFLLGFGIVFSLRGAC